MGRFFLRFGDRLIFSRRRNNVRRGFVGFVSHLFIAAGVIFSLEIALILLGVGDVILPMTCTARDFFTNLMF